jgi:O-antigen ligase
MILKEQAISPILIAAALVGSLFFQGRNLYVFLAVQAALVCALTYQLIRAQKETPVVKVDLLSGTLLFFWLWLAVSFFLSRVPYISGLTFWWVGVLPMVYCIYVLSPGSDEAWPRLVAALFIVGLILSLTGLYQFFVLREPSPRGPFIYRNLLAAFLTMLVLAISAHLLAKNDGGNARKYVVLGGIFLSVLTVGLIQSRGALLCFAVGAAVLLLSAYHEDKRRTNILLLLAVYSGALALAQLSSAGEMGERIITLGDPYEAGGSRFVIWDGSWELWKSSPWYGNGIGTYWLAYPEHRLPDDTNMGFYVHNDYLQILIESGWPALFLMLSVLTATLYVFVKAYRSASADASTRIESAGLFAALLSVFFHSLFDFNLYTMPTMILAGAAMGRLRSLCPETLPSVALKISPFRLLRPAVIRFCLLLPALLAGTYFLTVGISHHNHQRAERLIEAGQPAKAMDALQIAESLWPSHDLLKYLQANIYQLTLQENPQMEPAARKQAFDEAERKLRQAEKLNPWRPQAFVVRGQLYRQNRDFAEADWYEKASGFFEQALKIDPRCYDARVFYGQLLLETGQVSKAAEILKAGLSYWHSPDHKMIPYYRLTASVCLLTGDPSAAAAAGEKMTAVIAAYERAMRQSLKKPFE